MTMKAIMIIGIDETGSPANAITAPTKAFI
jgi:hypothetical protein